MPIGGRRESAARPKPAVVKTSADEWCAELLLPNAVEEHVFQTKEEAVAYARTIAIADWRVFRRVYHRPEFLS